MPRRSRSRAPSPSRSLRMPSSRCSVPTLLCPSSRADRRAFSMAVSARRENFSLLFMLRLLRKNAGAARRLSVHYPAASPPNGAKAAARKNYLQLAKKSLADFLAALPRRAFWPYTKCCFRHDLYKQGVSSGGLLDSRRVFLAAARSRRGSDMPPACHSLPRRRFAAPRAPPLLYQRTIQPFLLYQGKLSPFFSAFNSLAKRIPCF